MSKVRRFLAPALLLALAGATAVLVVRVALGAALSDAPQLALKVSRTDPEAIFEHTLIAHADRKTVVSDAEWARVAAAFARAPLADAPFVLAVLRHPPRQSGTDMRLLQEAERRHPRNRMARVLLLEQYARAGRIQDIVYEVATLDRLVPDARPVLVDVLATAVADPASAAAVFRAVRDPETLNALLTRLVAVGTPPATVLRLSRNIPPDRSAASASWQGALLDRLVDQGRYGEARALWQRFAGIAQPVPAGTAYNGAFARLPALPPFNWRLATGEVGAAELSRRGALSVEYFGRQSGELAGQLTLLPPGRYRLRFRIEGHADANASKLIWFVRCAQPGQKPAAGPALLTALLGNVGSSPRTVQADFVVPAAGCGAQWLTLEGVSAEFPTSQSIEIRDFDIRRVTGPS